LAIAGWGLKQHTWATTNGQPLAVRLVQGNIEQGIKFTPSHIQNTIETHLKLAATPTPAGVPSPQLVLLPETALAVFQHQLSPASWNAWRALAIEQHSTLMMGAALFGYLIRLALIFTAIWLVRDAAWVVMLPLGLTIIIAHLGLLFWEMKFISASLAFPALKPSAVSKESSAQ
jgi:hypothetical protein